MADPETMSTSELKAVIKNAGLKYDDCFEKSDLIARAKDALATSVVTEVDAESEFSWWRQR